MADKKTPNKWYWQCVKPTADPEPTNPPEEEEEEEPAEDIVLKEWEQCGGAGTGFAPNLTHCKRFVSSC
jgi:hypothetical protein